MAAILNDHQNLFSQSVWIIIVFSSGSLNDTFSNVELSCTSMSLALFKCYVSIATLF